MVTEILNNLDGAKKEIEYLRNSCSHQKLYHSALAIFNTVIYVDRTTEAVEERSKKIPLHAASGREHVAVGTGIALRLIVSGILLEKLEGKDWLEAAPSFAQLEGYIRGFMESAGVEPWPLIYAEYFSFERYRAEYIKMEDLLESGTDQN